LTNSHAESTIEQLVLIKENQPTGLSHSLRPNSCEHHGLADFSLPGIGKQPNPTQARVHN